MVFGCISGYIKPFCMAILVISIIKHCESCSKSSNPPSSEGDKDEGGDNACSIDCTMFDVGEHCEANERKCQCGDGPSCIGTNKPLCDGGVCKECSPTTHFECQRNGTTVCISNKYVCDDEWDCDNGADEKVFTNPKCSKTEACDEKPFLCEVDGKDMKICGKKRCDGNEDCDDGIDEMFCDEKFPKFVLRKCSSIGSTDEKCLAVEFPNDGVSDFILLNRQYPDDPDLFTLYNGHFKVEGTEVNLFLPDPEEPNNKNATIEFFSDHVGDCIEFSVQLLNQTELVESRCSQIRSSNNPDDTSVTTDSQFDAITASKGRRRALDANGYKFDAMVYYDDNLLKDKKNNHGLIKRKLYSAMSFVSNWFSNKEDPALTTRIKINTLSVAHAGNGIDFGVFNWIHPTWLGETSFHHRVLRPVMQKDTHNARLYIFFSGKKINTPGVGGLSRGYCSICFSDRTDRWNINMYPSDQVAKDILAHEIGHNLGIHHDEDRAVNGQICKGFHGGVPWEVSQCSINDFTHCMNSRDCSRFPLDRLGSSEKTKCPKTHPFAYLEGKYCCQTGLDLNGNVIKYSSENCKDHAYKQCPGALCENYRDKNSVSCGGHHANKCENCPGKHGRSWCNGDCKWDQQSNSCVGRNTVTNCNNSLKYAKHCNYWKSLGFCKHTHQKFMADHCKKDCGLC